MDQFMQIASSSSGNCSVLVSGADRVLIDAGTSARNIGKALQEIGMGIPELTAIVITHEHFDHISALKVLLHKKKIPVYTSLGTADAILSLIPEAADVITPFAAGSAFELTDTRFESFSTPHDASDSVGYVITTPRKKIGYATDLGFMPDEVFTRLSGLSLVVLESNYDEEMLRTGRYPYYLKRRIAAKNGHLSNTDAAKTVVGLVKSGVREIALSHLSAENNTSEHVEAALTLQCLCTGLEIGKDFLFSTAKRLVPSPLRML